jgi:hypothetical protein
MNLPSDVAQEAIDESGTDYLLGDIEDGSGPAQIILRKYQQCLMQLLRGANWNFARTTTQLTLLADATGNTPNVGTIVPVPWIYEYQLPSDCMRLRFIPWNMPWQNPGIPPGNITPPNPSSPIVTGLGNPQLTGQRIRPARFVVANDSNYPPPAGSVSWEIQGVSPSSRTVILTNVANAFAVYTALILYPSLWDSLFRAALVSYLASEIALPLAKDKKFGLTMRAQNIQIFKAKLEQARIRDGDEMTASSNLVVDWMQARWTGGAGGWGNTWSDGGGGANPWGGFGSWGECPLSDGTAY